MKYASVPRQEIGVRSIFNLLGPLVNPAGANAQVLGVYDQELTEKMAHVLRNLGTREAFVVCGEGTFDEISICGATKVSHLKDNEITSYNMRPEEYGLKRAKLEEIRGGNARENAGIVKDILGGERGPRRDMVLLNSASAFLVAGLDNSLKEGLERAKEVIDSGRARNKLAALVDYTQECKAFVRKEL
jgi:anthranilate phosphoribosyltransferase